MVIMADDNKATVNYTMMVMLCTVLMMTPRIMMIMSTVMLVVVVVVVVVEMVMVDDNKANNEHHCDADIMYDNDYGTKDDNLLHLYLSLYHEGCWGSTDDFTTSFHYCSLFSTALLDLANSYPVHFLMFSFHLFFCQPCLLALFTLPCKMVLARPDEWET